MKGRILIIDDSEETLFAVETVLQLAGHEVVSAPGAAAGTRVAVEEHDRIDLIVLDVMMLGPLGEIGHGLRVLRRLKRCPLTTKIPVVMHTGEAGERSRSVVMRWGAAAYVSKRDPDPQKLVSTIAAVLSGREI